MAFPANELVICCTYRFHISLVYIDLKAVVESSLENAGRTYFDQCEEYMEIVEMLSSLSRDNPHPANTPRCMITVIRSWEPRVEIFCFVDLSLSNESARDITR